MLRPLVGVRFPSHDITLLFEVLFTFPSQYLFTIGLSGVFNLSRYWKEPNRHPFLIKVDNELAGFVLINKVGSTPDVDWNIGEFFIVSKFQGKGVGSYVAEQIFNQFPGIWETSQIPENKAALAYRDWETDRKSVV